MTTKQKMFSGREVSPYFSKARNAPMENRLRDIAQAIKKKTQMPETEGRRTKQPTFSNILRASDNDADESGYYTATGGNLEDNTAPKVNRTWYAPKKSDQFMQPSGSESVYDKSERRALELRSMRKAQLLEQSRSKIRANAETGTGHEEQKEPPQTPDGI